MLRLNSQHHAHPPRNQSSTLMACQGRTRSAEISVLVIDDTWPRDMTLTVQIAYLASLPVASVSIGWMGLGV